MQGWLAGRPLAFQPFSYVELSTHGASRRPARERPGGLTPPVCAIGDGRIALAWAAMQDIVPQLAAELRLHPEQVQRTLALGSEGATVPFIARYRKEATDGLDEV